jgi:hypothetical protein
MFMEKIMILRIFVKLLTQQYTSPSAVREKIDKDQFALGFGLSQGLVEGTIEPVLGRERGNEE